MYKPFHKKYSSVQRKSDNLQEIEPHRHVSICRYKKYICSFFLFFCLDFFFHAKYSVRKDPINRPEKEI